MLQRYIISISQGPTMPPIRRCHFEQVTSSVAQKEQAHIFFFGRLLKWNVRRCLRHEFCLLQPHARQGSGWPRSQCGGHQPQSLIIIYIKSHLCPIVLLHTSHVVRQGCPSTLSLPQSRPDNQSKPLLNLTFPPERTPVPD